MKRDPDTPLRRLRRAVLIGLASLAIAACAPVTGLSPGWQISGQESLDIRQVWQADSVTWVRFGFHVPGAVRVSSPDGRALNWARSGRVIGVRHAPTELLVTLGRADAHLSHKGGASQSLSYGQISEHDRESVLARLLSQPDQNPSESSASALTQANKPAASTDNLAWSANWRAHAGPAGLASRMADTGIDAVITFVGSAMLPNDAGPVIDRMAEIARNRSGVLMIRADVDAGADADQRVLAGKRARIVAGLLERSGVDSKRLVVATVRDRFEPVRQAGLDASIRTDTHPVSISFKPMTAAGLGWSQRRDNG